MRERYSKRAIRTTRVNLPSIARTISEEAVVTDAPPPPYIAQAVWIRYKSMLSLRLAADGTATRWVIAGIERVVGVRLGEVRLVGGVFLALIIIIIVFVFVFVIVIIALEGGLGSGWNPRVMSCPLPACIPFFFEEAPRRGRQIRRRVCGNMWWIE